MSGGSRKPTVSGGGADAEVDALLHAAEDAVLLKLHTNSHLLSSPFAPADPTLEPDLARRFDALKSRGATAKPAPPAAAAAGVDELEARFAALKGLPGPAGETRVRLEDLGGEGDGGDDEDEVEKVMRWAMDAARLEAATAGGGEKAKHEEEEDKEDEEKSSVSSEEDDDEEEKKELEMEKRGREKEMGKNKSKKWFFF